jgi:hypothetical protein
MLDTALAPGLASSECEPPTPMAERTISQEERERSEAAGHTGYGTSYPMDDCDEVRRAVEAYGRAPEEHRPELRRKIVQRKLELGCDDVKIPESWHMRGAT